MRNSTENFMKFDGKFWDVTVTRIPMVENKTVELVSPSEEFADAIGYNNACRVLNAVAGYPVCFATEKHRSPEYTELRPTMKVAKYAKQMLDAKAELPEMDLQRTWYLYCVTLHALIDENAKAANTAYSVVESGTSGTSYSKHFWSLSNFELQKTIWNTIYNQALNNLDARILAVQKDIWKNNSMKEADSQAVAGVDAYTYLGLIPPRNVAEKFSPVTRFGRGPAARALVAENIEQTPEEEAVGVAYIANLAAVAAKRASELNEAAAVVRKEKEAEDARWAAKEAARELEDRKRAKHVALDAEAFDLAGELAISLAEKYAVPYKIGSDLIGYAIPLAEIEAFENTKVREELQKYATQTFLARSKFFEFRTRLAEYEKVIDSLGNS